MTTAAATTVARRPSKNRPAIRAALSRVGWSLCLIPIVGTVVLAIAGEWLAPYPPGKSVDLPFLPPGPGFPLGTDNLGRDVLSGILGGARGVILLPMMGVLVGSAISVTLGLLAGWRPGRATGFVLRGSEVLLVLPPLLIVLVVLGARPSPLVIVLLVAVLGIPSSLRYIRAAAARAARSGYVDHAVALGERGSAILGRELLPAVLGPVLADAGLRIVGAIYLIASASYLGVISTGDRNWAGMVAENREADGLNIWALVAPALAIVALVVAVNLLADRAGHRVRRDAP